MELANGCLCCSVKSDFVAALEGLMLKRDKFDYILIETTGSWPLCSACCAEGCVEEPSFTDPDNIAGYGHACLQLHYCSAAATSYNCHHQGFAQVPDASHARLVTNQDAVLDTSVYIVTCETGGLVPQHDHCEGTCQHSSAMIQSSCRFGRPWSSGRSSVDR